MENGVGRREFLGGLAGSVAALTAVSARHVHGAARIKFGAIGLNHGHINGQTEAVIRGGGGAGLRLREGTGPRRRLCEAVSAGQGRAE